MDLISKWPEVEASPGNALVVCDLSASNQSDFTAVSSIVSKTNGYLMNDDNLLDELLDELGSLCGIEREFWDIFGEKHVATPETKRRILTAMGFSVGSEEELADGVAQMQHLLHGRVLAPVTVLRQDRLPFKLILNFRKHTPDVELEWRLVAENSEVFSGRLYRSQLEWVGEHTHRTQEGAEITIDKYAFRLPGALPLGYHRLELRVLSGGEGALHQTTVIVTPPKCFEPEALRNGGRLWGIAAQLYGLRSKRNWGIGDFTDLKNLVGLAQQLGAGVVGISPLHALSLQNLAGASPYCPTDRVRINQLLIDVEVVPEFEQSAAAQKLVRSRAFQSRLKDLRNHELVDYPGVWSAKREVLELLYQSFRTTHRESNSERSMAFERFVKEQGEALRLYCLYQLLEEHFRTADPELWGWPVWPEDYRTPHSAQCAEFAAQHRERLEFFQYIEWAALEQLRAVDEYAQELQLPIGLYADIALGPNSGGAETWVSNAAYSFGVSLGAPPDDYSLLGQSWGITPFNPVRLRETAYGPFIELVRANMRFAGAVRLDHVMCLARLFWVPDELKPADGGYVRYPTEDLIGIIALESLRNRCLVIGEDLGTVPEDLRVSMNERFLLSYRVMYFMKNQFGDFCPTEEYQRNALVTATTHDLPTLVGYWNSHDIEMREKLELYPTSEFAEKQRLARSSDKERLLSLMIKAGVFGTNGSVPKSFDQMTPELARGLQLFLAQTPSCLFLMQLEDLLGIEEQANLPGTTTEHPNWRRKLSVDLEKLARIAHVVKCVTAVREERGVPLL